MNHELVKEELDLIRSILKGYPPSIARADIFRALNVVQAETDCAPLSTKVHPVPLGFEKHRPSLSRTFNWKKKGETA